MEAETCADHIQLPVSIPPYIMTPSEGYDLYNENKRKKHGFLANYL